VVNVASQEQAPDSLLARVTALVQARRRHQAFGRGTMVLLPCDNPKVLVFERAYGDEVVVVIANLARSPQAATIEFPPAMSGFSPLDLIDRDVLPPVGIAPYALTLAPQAFRWLQLVASPEIATGGRYTAT
jgi:maltose alpha-D-glucosyltransferase / alpha-amylase